MSEIDSVEDSYEAALDVSVTGMLITLTVDLSDGVATDEVDAEDPISPALVVVMLTRRDEVAPDGATIEDGANPPVLMVVIFETP